MTLAHLPGEERKQITSSKLKENPYQTPDMEVAWDAACV